MTPVPALAGRRTTCPRAEAPDDLVSDRIVVLRYTNKVFAGVLNGLLDGQRNFPGLSVTDANYRLFVADGNECCKRKPSTTLDHLGHTVDFDHTFLEVKPLGADHLDAGCIHSLHISCSP